MADDLDLIALSLLPVWRWRDVAVRLRAGDAPGGVLAEQAAACSPRSPRCTPAALRDHAARALARAARHEIDRMYWHDPGYPASLLAIIDPPPVLWIRGSRDALERPAVAIVGSRAGSPYALDVAERLACDLAAAGLTIVSGLARGVDSAAHRGALSARGVTLAVLGCGPDIVYPREHKALAHAIVEQGAIVSELVPGTPPHPRFFPLRNRIISGLVRGVIVVEAGEKSGSLITARCALEHGRDVLAVPGNVLTGRNRGGHALLRDGARLVETAEDVLQELRLDLVMPRAAAGTATRRAADPWLAWLLPGEPCDLDEICARSGLSSSRLLARLFELELQGVVRRVGGGRFVRLDSSC